jgi:succinate dehydrogenase / fumarate reductase flavoprotein subunit/fumarate reductase flavoprotein subunit
MVARTRVIGRDLSREPIEVSPTAHFQMGGVLIDADCRTAIDGLLVAGEDAGGTHGANRLGGNGVAESTVFGARAGDTAALIAGERGRRRPLPTAVAASVARATAPRRSTGPAAEALTRELKEAMWSGCGLVRSREGLRRASAIVDDLLERAKHLGAPGPAEWNLAWQQALDLRNQLEVARTMVAAATVREESRGDHFREDFPTPRDDEWLRYVVTRLEDDRVLTETRPVKFTRLHPHADVLEDVA